MDVKAIVTNPLVITAGGALLGYVSKAGFDLWSSEVKRQQELAGQFVKRIEDIAPTYYLLANTAYLLSFCLNNYLDTKRAWQLLPQDDGATSDGRLSAYDNLRREAERTAKEALFYAGKLYRVIYDNFWVKGGRYLMPNRWANKAIEDLHNKLVATFYFNPDILFRYIKSDTEIYGFSETLAKAKKDLREEYESYRNWLLTEERQVLQAAVYAQVYSNLFGQQMDLLYQDYLPQKDVVGGIDGGVHSIVGGGEQIRRTVRRDSQVHYASL